MEVSCLHSDYVCMHACTCTPFVHIYTPQNTILSSRSSSIIFSRSSLTLKTYATDLEGYEYSLQQEHSSNQFSELLQVIIVMNVEYHVLEISWPQLIQNLVRKAQSCKTIWNTPSGFLLQPVPDNTCTWLYKLSYLISVVIKITSE